ncbi:eCIS core domain-containing protein [Streptomyces sp. NPDC002491]
MHEHEQEPTGGTDVRRLAREARGAGPETVAQAAQALRGRDALTPQMVLALQRSVGNAAVGRMLNLQRHGDGGCCDGREPEDRSSQDAPVQRSTVHDVLRSPGKPLAESLRSEMEERMDADFSDVVMHDDTAAARSTDEVDAEHYTSRNHIVVGRGGIDKRTLAHELTHVLQQREGEVAGADNGAGLRVSDPSDRFEREAEANAARVMARSVPAADTGPGPSADRRKQTRSTSRRTVMQRVKRSVAPGAVGPKATVPSAHQLRGTETRKAKLRKIRKIRKQNLSVAGIKREFNTAGIKGLGHTGGGMWTSKVTQVGSRSFKTSPDEQVLRHLSTQLFWYVKNALEQKDEQEVQAMYVNGGIVVASNLDASLEAAFGSLKEKMEGYVRAGGAADGEEGMDEEVLEYPLQEVLGGEQNPGDLRASGVARKFQGLSEGSRPSRAGAERMLHSILQEKFNPLQSVTMEESRAVIGDPVKMKDRIIFLRGGSSYHAEQKLVLALHGAGGTGKAWIAGKKRPCAVCFATLSYARSAGGMDISFQGRPGGYFQPAIPGLVALGKALGHTEDQVMTWLRGWLTADLRLAQSLKLKKGASRSSLATRAGVTPKLNDADVDTGYGSLSDSGNEADSEADSESESGSD